MNTGLVVVGAIGDNLRMDYTAVGDTTNLAARLQQVAEPGSVLIGEATARLVEGYVELASEGPMQVRGRQAPVTVHRVTGAGARRSALDRVGRTLSRFVGRAREVEALGGLAGHVEAGHGRAVGVVGEPGVGKSRLLLEARAMLEARGMLWREGRCLSYGASIPYLPVMGLLRDECGLGELDAPEVIAAKMGATLDELDLDQSQMLPYLLHVLGVKTPDSPLAETGGEQMLAQTLAALRALLLRRARRRPLVLVVEDLHWVDGASAVFFELIADDVAGAPILLLGTYRPGYRPSWLDRSYATQLALAPLGQPDSLAVVRSVLPRLDIDAALAVLLVDRAEGNPLFLEELAHAVEGAGDAAATAVPDTIHGVLTARIDRLPEGAKRLLQTAAVLGREFSARVLVRLADGVATLDADLHALGRLEFLYRRPDADEPVYVFKHALTQEVALATLVARERRVLHRRAAEALAAAYPERGRELAPLLAHHYLEAEAWVEAAGHARWAAELARDAYANREALVRYGQALDAAERAGLGGDAGGPARGARRGVRGDGRFRAGLRGPGGGAGAGGGGGGRYRAGPHPQRPRGPLGRAPGLRTRSGTGAPRGRGARARRRPARPRAGPSGPGRDGAESRTLRREPA